MPKDLGLVDDPDKDAEDNTESEEQEHDQLERHPGDRFDHLGEDALAAIDTALESDDEDATSSLRTFKSEPTPEKEAVDQPTRPKLTAIETPRRVPPTPTAPIAPSLQTPLSLRDDTAAPVVAEDATPPAEIGHRGMRQITFAVILAGVVGLAIGWLVVSVWLG